MDNTVALGIQPFKVDVATPLMQAAKIKQEQVETQQRTQAMQQDAAGQFARGVAVYADKPEFAEKWAQGLDDLHSRGLMPTQAYQNLRDNPSPMVLQSILAQTKTPELAFRETEANRAQGNTDRAFGLQQQQFEEEKRKTGVAENAPLSVAPGATLVRKGSGEAVFSNKNGAFDSSTLDAMADQYLAGDKSVMTNIGRGAQGAENIASLRQRITERGAVMGLKPADIAAKLQDFAAEGAGKSAQARTLGVQESKMGTAAFEAEGAINLARDAIKKVPRTGFLPFNQLIQGYQKQTLSPDQAELYTRTQGVINAYAAVMSRGANITTDASRHKAEELLSTASNEAVYNRVMDTMLSEINMAKNAPDKMRDFYRKKYGDKAIEGGGGAAPAAPAGPAAAPPGASGGLPPPPPGFQIVQ